MFCPGCGSEENGPSQYCRRCGSDLGLIRAAMEDPTAITGGRDEVGRALAEKIREVSSAKELTRVINWVLPKIEKFLETPEERRLRRIRAGTITASVGSGLAIAFTALAIISKENIFFLASSLGIILFFIGMGILINGFLSSIPRSNRPAMPHRAVPPPLAEPTADLALPEASLSFTSVIEHTTAHLEEKRR